MIYASLMDPVPHTCWDDSEGLVRPHECAGCAQAIAYPCRYCAYGVVYTTHNPVNHHALYDSFSYMTLDENDHLVEADTTWLYAPHVWYNNHGVPIGSGKYEQYHYQKFLNQLENHFESKTLEEVA